MAAPTVHLLSAAAYGVAPTDIPDVISATTDDGGSPQEYVSADNPDVALVAVDRIASTVSIVGLSYMSALDVGDSVGPLVLTLKPRAEGKGVVSTPETITYEKAIVIGKQGGPVIEGNPTYTVIFRCHKAPV